MRTYEVGVKGAPWGPRTVQAVTAGKAKYEYLLDILDAWPDITFKDLTCRSLGTRPLPPTAKEIAQREADSFNADHPVGTMLRYWSGLKEGEPTGIAPISHLSTVMCEHAVIWMEGVRSCHSLSHVERAGRKQKRQMRRQG